MASRQPYVAEQDANITPDSTSDRYENEKNANVLTTDVQAEAVHALVEKIGDDQAHGLAPVADIDLVLDKVTHLSAEQCKAMLEQQLEEHKWDYNYGEALRIKIRELLDGPHSGQSAEEWELELKAETAVNCFYSPYPEVRAITTPDDDPTLPCETIRAHFLGYIWVLMGNFVNTFFYSRFPLVQVSSAVMQVLLYPCGMALAKILPDWGFTFMGSRHSLNPGPWNYKEQMFSTIIISVGSGTAYVFFNLQTQQVYYGDKWLTAGYSIMLLLSTQLMGLGFAGFLRRYVIYAPECIWPSILPTLALNKALLLPEKKGENLNGWKLSRYTFFWLFFIISFVYYWLPGWAFPALAYFSWMCWIAPNNFNLAAITGVQYGLGFNPISTLSWNNINQIINPLASPFFATLQLYIGYVISALIIIATYYSNVNWVAYLPINSNAVFDNTGVGYNISRVINPATGKFDRDAYHSYSPPYYSASQLVVYGAFFAYYPLAMVFVFLDFWRPITRAYGNAMSSGYRQIKHMGKQTGAGLSALVRGDFRGCVQRLTNMNADGSIYDSFNDPLTSLLRAYPEVPDWWFFIVFLVSFVLALVVITTYSELNTPVWSVFFVIGINLAFLLPFTYINAISGTSAALNVAVELIAGYALPGHPEALMLIKAYGYNIGGQADNYISDQKMGYYAKVPPRAMFRGQIAATIFTALLTYGVIDFVDSIPGICTPTQEAHFNCEAGSLTFFSASIVWGAIGPKIVFGVLYPILKWCFLIGFLVGLAWWSGKRFGPSLRDGSQRVLPGPVFSLLNIAVFRPMSVLKYVHPGLLTIGMLNWAPLNLSYFHGALYVSFAFMYYLKRYKTAWWEKYTYLLGAALPASVALASIIIFFAVQYNNVVTPNWWGYNVTEEGVDGYGGRLALLTTLPAKGYFGLDTW